MQIVDPASRMPQLLRIGFRPFFLGALLFALLSMGHWLLALTVDWIVTPDAFTPVQWHAHEMVFGYSGAVIAGFLLTAVQNWTQRKTIDGLALALLFGCWAAARLLPLSPLPAAPLLVMVLDGLFLGGLLIALVRPLVASGNHQQWGIIAKLVLLLACAICFHLPAWDILPVAWVDISLLVGLYTVIGLILMMARRVLPFFTEMGIAEAGPRTNHRWVDLLSLTFFLLFMLGDLLSHRVLAIAAAAAFVIVSLVRLHGWYHPGIWSHPLLWILHLGYWSIPLGIALRASASVTDIPASLGLHLLGVGGIGLFTAGMMARVSLGHTGRDVTMPPRGVALAFLLLIAGTLLRSLLPLLAPAGYSTWLLLTQLCWLAAFALLLRIFAGILVGPRADGRYA